MARCEDCPLASEKNPIGVIVSGESIVRVFRDGALDYLHVSEAECVVSYGQLTREAVSRYFPELRRSIDRCDGTETAKEPRPGLLGRLGLKNSVNVCPGVARVFPYQQVESVRDYFDGEC